jgi:hypothetical protein
MGREGELRSQWKINGVIMFGGDSNMKLALFAMAVVLGGAAALIAPRPRIAVHAPSTHAAAIPTPPPTCPPSGCVLPAGN